MVHVATAYDLGEPEEYTLRECLEWWKRCVALLEGVTLSRLETKELNARWVHLCNAVAEREGVPTGSLSYFLGELAQAELQLKASGEAESQNTPDNFDGAR